MKPWNWWSLLAILFFASSGQAARTTIDVGFGPSLKGVNPKAAQVALDVQFNTASIAAGCLGLFTAPFNAACDVVLSARVTTKDGVFLAIGAGPAYVFQKMDPFISANWNATLEAKLGITQDGWGAGAKWKHISDGAPILGPGPNLGLDHILAFLEFGL